MLSCCIIIFDWYDSLPLGWISGVKAVLCFMLSFGVYRYLDGLILSYRQQTWMSARKSGSGDIHHYIQEYYVLVGKLVVEEVVRAACY